MATWVAIPQGMVEEHIRWHNETAPYGKAGRRVFAMGLPGSGEEFLDWHGDYFSRYAKWRRQKGLKPIPAWEDLPSRIGKAAGLREGWSPLDLTSYQSVDAVGIAIESEMHWLVHQGASSHFDDPVLRTSASPLSPHFWSFLGLILLWREEWEEHHMVQSQPAAVLPSEFYLQFWGWMV